MQVSFWELLGNTFEDFTIIVLVISGVLSIGLELAFGDSDHGWVEGAAILAAVAVVALVTAVNDFEKEKQFRDLSALSSESQAAVVCHYFAGIPHACCCIARRALQAVLGTPRKCLMSVCCTFISWESTHFGLLTRQDHVLPCRSLL